VLDERAKQGVVVADRGGGEVSLVEQFIEFDGREVGERIGLDMPPDQLDRIQLRGIPRQQGGSNAVGIAFEPAFDGLPPMRLRAIPDQFDRAANGAAQLFQEYQDGRSIEVGVRQQAEVRTHAVPKGRYRQRADNRDLGASPPALHQHWGLAPGCPAAANEWPHHESAFVEEDDRRTAAPGDYSGYKAMLAKEGNTEVGCLAHARRKFFDLFDANKSQIAQDALKLFAQLYDVEREVRDLDAGTRREIRQAKAKPIANALHDWMVAHRLKVPDGSATAKALNYSLNRWQALTRYLDDGTLPVDNNFIENRIRPIALGRSNWLFVGSLRAGQRAAAIMSLIQSARLNGIDPYIYLADVFTRLPTLPASRIKELLPHRWPSATKH
jgi:hypothetical protein